jgi:predicted glycosyltransferase
MTNQPKRFLFNAHNRRGLGHLMRGLNIAREIRKLSPEADILFYTRSESAAELCGKQFGYFIEEDLERNQHWAGVIDSFNPDVIIYDTLLPKDATDTPPCSGRTAYIMRKCKPDRQHEIFSHPFLASVDLILIPHEPAEFGYTLPDTLIKKASFVGPIIRQAEIQPQQMLRDKYKLLDGEFLLTSTVGGGGFEDKARAFFETIFGVHQQIHSKIPNLRHLVIKGPNFTTPLPQLDGIEIIDSEPEMVNLLAISNLVIAEGGYNTVNEVRLAKTPAIFLPSDRNYDDQRERVLELEEKGLAFVYAQSDGNLIAEKIINLCLDKTLLTELQQRYKNDTILTGNKTAAQKLVELASA